MLCAPQTQNETQGTLQFQPTFHHQERHNFGFVGKHTQISFYLASKVNSCMGLSQSVCLSVFTFNHYTKQSKKIMKQVGAVLCQAQISLS